MLSVRCLHDDESGFCASTPISMHDALKNRTTLQCGSYTTDYEDLDVDSYLKGEEAGELSKLFPVFSPKSHGRIHYCC